MGDFTDLVVWKESATLAVSVAALCETIRGPSRLNARDQLVRAAESIPANIAEGVARGVSRDGLRFLRTAAASAAEVENHLRLASLNRRCPEHELKPRYEHTRRVRYLLARFINSVERRL